MRTINREGRQPRTNQQPPEPFSDSRQLSQSMAHENQQWRRVSAD